MVVFATLGIMKARETEKVVVTVEVRGADRIRALDAIKAMDHSSRSSVLNKGLDRLIAEDLAEAVA